MIYFAAALFGAWFLTFTFFGWLYLVDHGIFPIINIVIGAAIGVGVAAVFVATHS